MNKRKILVVIVSFLVLLLLAGLAVFQFKSKKPSSPVVPVGKEEERELALATWEDQAGFSFVYPESIKIDPHGEDTENYAHLELTSAGRAGKIMIWVKDTKYAKIDDWVKKEVGEEDQVFDSQLGGKLAKKVAFSDPKKLVAAAIDANALVLVEMFPDEEGFWQGIYDGIAKSFTFIPLETEKEIGVKAPTQTGGGSNVILEEEEVIE